jgi:hypothetical protein
MRKQTFAAALLAVGLIGLFTVGQASAQFGQTPYSRPGTSPYANPSISPYLNLTRGGSAALNYYNLVRPQVDFTNALNMQNRSIMANQMAITGLEQSNMAFMMNYLSTGHTIRFMSYQQYFLNMSPMPTGISGLAYGSGGVGGGYGSANAGMGGGAYGQGASGFGGQGSSPFGRGMTPPGQISKPTRGGSGGK